MAKHEKNEVLIAAIEGSLEGTANTTSKGSVFNDNLPENLTPEIVENVSDYVTDFVACGLEAVGRYSIKAMVADKELKDVTATIGMGAFGEVSYDINRERLVTPPKGDPVVVKGGSRHAVAFIAGKNSGALAAAKKSIKALADEAL